jgi:hypothetical protein
MFSRVRSSPEGGGSPKGGSSNGGSPKGGGSKGGSSNGGSSNRDHSARRTNERVERIRRGAEGIRAAGNDSTRAYAQRA